MFNDKESFVTPAYRAKLAELKKLEEEERLRELREGILVIIMENMLFANQVVTTCVYPYAANLDVTKQQDLSGFYRHLYKQTFSDEQPKKPEPEEPVTFKKEAVESEFKSRRQYRSRREENEEEEEVAEEEEAKGASPEREEMETPDDDDPKSSDAVGKSKKDRRPAASASLLSAAATDRAAAADRAAEKTASVAKPTTAASSDSDQSDDDRNKSATPEPEVVQPKVKVDIWKKRTTGPLLDEAIERYLARKAAREEELAH